MKKNQMIYWTFTSLIALMMTFSAYMYVTAPQIKAGFVHLGYPDYFRIELAIAKVIGVILLIAPVSSRIKEWVYAGFAITFISAFVAHTSVDGAQTAAAPIVALVLLLVSYVFYHKVYDVRSLNTSLSH